MFFEKWFGKKKKPADDGLPVLSGRYSDNNKTVAKVNRWTEAETLFREKKITESFEAFFDYLSDDTEQNVVFERNGIEGKFHFYQGSKIVRGTFDENRLRAEITLAKMPMASVAVMRRLLEMNFNLFYGRYALDNDRLCMRFDTDVKTANPNKLYYGLKELAIKADKLDDLLVQEFVALQSLDTEHLLQIPQPEKEIKYQYLQKWIKETLDYIEPLDNDKFSGGIAYLLLTLAFRIDYLLIPEGRLLHELEKVVDIYFNKEEKQTAERNNRMIEGFKKIAEKPKEEIFENLFRSKHTFSIVAPPGPKAVSDSINGAIQNMQWYRDNQHIFIANKVLEYGISYCQYSYSLPRPLSELFKLFMQINYSDFFAALGYTKTYYDIETKLFDEEKLIDKINRIINEWREKHPRLEFKTDKLRFNKLINFNHSFVNELGALNFDI